MRQPRPSADFGLHNPKASTRLGLAQFQPIGCNLTISATELPVVAIHPQNIVGRWKHSVAFAFPYDRQHSNWLKRSCPYISTRCGLLNERVISIRYHAPLPDGDMASSTQHGIRSRSHHPSSHREVVLGDTKDCQSPPDAEAKKARCYTGLVLFLCF